MSQNPGRTLTRVARSLAALAIVAMVFAGTAYAQPPEHGRVLFIQQDEVQAFDLNTGKGYQIGTATGLVAGTTFVDFQFAPTGPPTGDALPIAFHNKVIISDIDGDQLFFDNDGSGTFHLGVPGFSFAGSGGPLTGTYVLTAGTGKYAGWKVGTTYAYRAIATNPPTPPGGLGNVYVQVSLANGPDKP